MTTSRWSKGPVVAIIGQRTPDGDFGPCAHESCDTRAVHIIDMTIDGLFVITYVCETHHARLQQLAEVKP